MSIKLTLPQTAALKQIHEFGKTDAATLTVKNLITKGLLTTYGGSFHLTADGYAALDITDTVAVHMGGSSIPIRVDDDGFVEGEITGGPDTGSAPVSVGQQYRWMGTVMTVERLTDNGKSAVVTVTQPGGAEWTKTQLLPFPADAILQPGPDTVAVMMGGSSVPVRVDDDGFVEGEITGGPEGFEPLGHTNPPVPEVLDVSGVTLEVDPAPVARELAFGGMAIGEYLNTSVDTNKPFEIVADEQETSEPTSYAKRLLGALQGKKSLYGGTANPAKVNKRRAKNRVARKSRKRS